MEVHWEVNILVALPDSGPFVGTLPILEANASLRVLPAHSASPDRDDRDTLALQSLGSLLDHRVADFPDLDFHLIPSENEESRS